MRASTLHDETCSSLCAGPDVVAVDDKLMFWMGFSTSVSKSKPITQNTMDSPPRFTKGRGVRHQPATKTKIGLGVRLGVV